MIKRPPKRPALKPPAKPRRGGGPRGLAAVVPKVAGALFRGQGFAVAGVLTDWPHIVGAKLAEHCCPEKLGRDGTLHLRVDGGWALELAHLEPEMLDRIAGYVGFRAVKRIAIVQGPLPPRPASRLRKIRALEPAEAKALQDSLAATGDAGLRGALEGLGRAVIGDGRKPECPGESGRNGA